MEKYLTNFWFWKHDKNSHLEEEKRSLFNLLLGKYEANIQIFSMELPFKKLKA